MAAGVRDKEREGPDAEGDRKVVGIGSAVGVVGGKGRRGLGGWGGQAKVKTYSSFALACSIPISNSDQTIADSHNQFSFRATGHNKGSWSALRLSLMLAL